MTLSELGDYAAEHPYVTAGVVFGGGLVLLWAFGFFTGSSGGGGQTSGAAAFYQAEAAQAQIGGQIQIATLQTAADTAKAGIARDQAVALAHIQAGAATTINQQNATEAGHLADLQATTAMHVADVNGATVTQVAQIQGSRDIQIAGIGGDVAKHTVDTQYLATVSNNQTALATVTANNDAALRSQAAGIAAQQAHDAALVQQQQLQLDQSKVAAQSQADANWINFVMGANTGFRTIIPAEGTG